MGLLANRTTDSIPYDPFVVMQYYNAKLECLMPDDVVYKGQWIPPDKVQLFHFVWWHHYGEKLQEYQAPDDGHVLNPLELLEVMA